MNTIPQTGKWNEISSLLNANFNTIATQLLQFANVAVYNKGIHADVESLQQSYPTPMVGSFAYVGTTPPYKIYTYRATGWQDSGVNGEPMETDFSDITIATETASGLMSPDHVATLNGLSETINGQTNEITGVKNRVGSLERQSATTTMTVSRHGTRITGLENIVTPLKESFDDVEDTVEEHTNQIASVNDSVTQIVGDVASLNEYIENNRIPIETLTQAILKLGVFNTSGDAEQLAATYANNPLVFIMLYQTQGGDSGIIYQYFSNTSATIQFLYLQGQRYVREVSWDNGTITAGTWKNITGSERIKGLSFNQDTNILSFEDALGGDNWGGVKIPIQEVIAKIVANAPEDFDTLKEIADYIASDKTKASEIEVAISDLKKKVIESVDVSELDGLVAIPTPANGKADYWLTKMSGGISTIIGRVFLFEDNMLHKVTQVVMSNQMIDDYYPDGNHAKEGLTVYYRFYGHNTVDVPLKQWTPWKKMYDSEDRKMERAGEFLSKMETAFGTTDLDVIVGKLAEVANPANGEAFITLKQE